MQGPGMLYDDAESEHVVKDRTVYPEDGLTECFRLSVKLNAPPEKGQYIVNFDPNAEVQEVYLVYPEAVEIPNRAQRKDMKPGYTSIT